METKAAGTNCNCATGVVSYRRGKFLTPAIRRSPSGRRHGPTKHRRFEIGDRVQWDLAAVDSRDGSTVQNNDFMGLYGRGPFKVLSSGHLGSVGFIASVKTTIGVVHFNTDWFLPY